MKELRFCYEKILKTPKKDGLTQAVAFKAKYWKKGHDLKVFFIKGTQAQRTDVKKALDELLNPLTLTWTEVFDRQESEIRISFKYGYGSYSYLGSDAVFIPKEEETLNLGWDEYSTTLHELCHTLNLAHEHQNPKGGVVWDEQQVIKDLSGAPNYWSEAQIRYNVLDKLNPTQTDATDFDPKSIMLYYFPNSWTIGDFQTNDNFQLSQTDKDFLFEKYGEVAADTTAPVITLKGGEYISLDYNEQYVESGATATDNIDGDISDRIIKQGSIDTTIEGLQYMVYMVFDSVGNKAEKIRTIFVREEVEKDPRGCLSFITDIFLSKKDLGKLKESQLITIAELLGLSASEKDLKKDTLNRIWEKMNG